ncbi:MAG: tRNA adenosine(34) deaminase TadA [Planctomycetota bacterium]|nr:tRNA adenosine(34) deaminase TadA [Planctomycetota bacterium]
MSNAPEGARRHHEQFMSEALKEAQRAQEEGEVPVGAVVVHDGRVIARAHNQREVLKDPTAHAEMIAITQAAEALENWRLEGTTMYVTLEPCVMCAGAIVLARVTLLVFGAADPKAGACGSVFDILADRRLNHRVEVVRGVMEEKAAALLRGFFRQKRQSTDGE